MARKVLVVYRDHEYPYKPGKAEIFEDIDEVWKDQGWLVLFNESGTEHSINRDVIFTCFAAPAETFEEELARHAGDEEPDDQGQGDE